MLVGTATEGCKLTSRVYSCHSMKGCILPLMSCGPCPLLLPLLFLHLHLLLLLGDAGHSIIPLLPCIPPDLADVKMSALFAGLWR